MDDELLQEFLGESWENLGRLDAEIVRLEKEPGDAELLASIFRTIHTIKGTCGFLGLTNLGSMAHAGENLLGRMREGQLAVTPAAISVVLRGVDVIKDLLRHLEATGKEPETDHSALIAELDGFATTGDTVTAAATSSPVVASVVTSPTAVVEAKPVVPAAAATPAIELMGTQSGVPGGSQDGGRGVADLSVRVHVDVLDRLMNLVGELVLTRNQLIQLARGDEESKYAAPISHLNRVTTDLQEGVMKTRMQPIGNAWSKLPRLIRDLEQFTGKRFELEMSGAETELDRTVLDAIKDPLTHMVRNAADHGIETPEARRRAGKPEAGTVRLNAYHEGGHVIISLSDDGRGIDPARIGAKAVEKGLVTEAELARMAEHDVLSLIFRPGFSTAETVSAVSGRGVGMDVVKTAIERIGGTVDLQSAVGRGTTVRIRIPLTLAIISALVVESGRQKFAIPQLGIVELVRLPVEDRQRIERVHNREVFRLRDRLLPLVHLNEVLGLPEAECDRDVNIVVVQVGSERLGLIVSEVFDTEEIVVKPVGRLLKEIAIYQGTTILGDGQVILILDVAGVAAETGGVRSNGAASKIASDSDAESDGTGATSLLVFDAGDDIRMAVPLALVARLEEFEPSQIERSGELHVIQYRGGLLPLLPVAGRPLRLRSPQPVVVFSDGPQAMGLLVGGIRDIVDERLSVRMCSARPGVIGTAIVGGRATDLLDTRHYLLQASPDWFSRTRPVERRRVLTVDDSPFFRLLTTTALEAEGYTVVAVDGGRRALAALDAGSRFDAVVSDIEMPEIDGYALGERLRLRPDTAGLPMIAVSSAPPRLAEGRALSAGFDVFLQKFDAARLVSTLEELWQRQESAASHRGGRE